MISQAMIDGAKQRVRDANNGYLVTPVYEKGEVIEMSDTILAEIREDIKWQMKSGNKEMVSCLKVLVSDIQRDPHKDYSDEKVLPIIKKAVKTLYENHDQFGNDRDLIDAEYLERKYLPAMTSETDMMDFLETVDVTDLPNKMMAIGLIKKHFPEGSVDGALAKRVVMDWK